MESLNTKPPYNQNQSINLSQAPLNPEGQNIDPQSKPLNSVAKKGGPSGSSKGKFVLTFLVSILLVSGALVGSYFLLNSDKATEPGEVTPTTAPPALSFKFEKFSSEEEFKSYIEAGKGLFEGFGLGAGLGLREAVPLEAADFSLQSPEEGVPGGLGQTLERVSETNVQVKGIDEPDIVKTDGNSIFFASSFSRFYPLMEQTRDLTRPGIIAPPQTETKIIKAFPPAELSKTGSIDKTGDLLLNENILTIFSGNTIYGFDINDSANPKEKWSLELESKNQIITSRLLNGKIYLIAQTGISGRPCPIPLIQAPNIISIPCGDIYHPITKVPVDSTFTVLQINPSSGEIDKKVSLVGSSSSSVTYMSRNAIYLSYLKLTDISSIFYNFFVTRGSDLISQETLDKLKKLEGYDISSSSKFIELQVILETYYNSLDSDERLRIQNEMSNRMNEYLKEKSRELTQTAIVKMNANDFSIASSGQIPGRLLNQFSLDEYQGNLRAATTVSATIFGGGETVNDIYVLDANLNTIGSILDLGKDERIYSVRFIEDKGYIVTFRQIDPFFVLNLSNPSSPSLSGELKIPGYSSYLHPINKDTILGVGKEGSKVKISLFDVLSPENPTEASKYLLDEFWSDILNTHHAFLLDAKHQVFFLPGSKGGYLFSYKNNSLELIKAVSDIRARRALYINDYMYIIGDDKLVVLNEADWEKVNNLSF